MTKTLELAKQLISIPSYVGDGCCEIQIANFIFDWLKANTNLTVIKQPVIDGRYNIIATSVGPTKVVLAGHIDTVQAGSDWNTDPFTPVIKNGRLYGRGASDMKGSLAAMLQAVADVKDVKGLMVLIYIDEEYDFVGMKAFIKKYCSSLKPELVISLDGYAGKMGTGCRGLIEVSFKLLGKTGHAGRPDSGINAILNGTNCITKLKRQLATKYSDPVLGTTTLNLAYIQGGLNLGDGIYGRQGNNIADIAEFVLDIRPASPSLGSKQILKLLQKYAASAKLELRDFAVRHDLGAWATPYEDIQKLVDIPGTPETFDGYVDTQMIWSSCGQPVCIAIGAATRALAHATNEYVELNDLEITYQILMDYLSTLA